MRSSYLTIIVSFKLSDYSDRNYCESCLISDRINNPPPQSGRLGEFLVPRPNVKGSPYQEGDIVVFKNIN